MPKRRRDTPARCSTRRAIRIALAPGEYLDDDLVGCDVEDAVGTRYGAVERVEHYPSSDMLVVGGADGAAGERDRN